MYTQLLLALNSQRSIFVLGKQISHIKIECGKYQKIFNGLLLVPQNVVMNLNNVVKF